MEEGLSFPFLNFLPNVGLISSKTCLLFCPIKDGNPKNFPKFVIVDAPNKLGNLHPHQWHDIVAKEEIGFLIFELLTRCLFKNTQNIPYTQQSSISILVLQKANYHHQSSNNKWVICGLPLLIITHWMSWFILASLFNEQMPSTQEKMVRR